MTHKAVRLAERAALMDWNKFGMRVRLKRTEARLGLRELANIIGVSAATVCRVENGKEPLAGTYIALNKWLGVSKADFQPQVNARSACKETAEWLESRYPEHMLDKFSFYAGVKAAAQ